MLKKLFHLLPIGIQIKLMKKVTLLYTNAGYGDTLMITAVVHEIKKRYGSKINIDINGAKTELLENNPNISNLGNGHWGINLNYHKSTKNIDNNFNIITDMLKKVGIKNKNPKPYIYLTQKEIYNANKITNQYGIPIVTIQTSSGKFSSGRKEWSLEHWNRLTNMLTNCGCTILNLGDRDSCQINNTIDLRGKITINESIALIRNSDLHIGVVSSLMHGAVAIGRAAIIIYGGFERASLHGYKNVIPIESKIACSPCIKYNCKIPPCPFENRCMKEISPEEIFSKASELLNLESTNK